MISVFEGFLKKGRKCIKENTGKSEYIKTKNFYLSENPIDRVKRQATNITNQGLLSDYKENSKNL